MGEREEGSISSTGGRRRRRRLPCRPHFLLARPRGDEPRRRGQRAQRAYYAMRRKTSLFSMADTRRRLR